MNIWWYQLGKHNHTYYKNMIALCKKRNTEGLHLLNQNQLWEFIVETKIN